MRKKRAALFSALFSCHSIIFHLQVATDFAMICCGDNHAAAKTQKNTIFIVLGRLYGDLYL